MSAGDRGAALARDAEGEGPRVERGRARARGRRRGRGGRRRTAGIHGEGGAHGERERARRADGEREHEPERVVARRLLDGGSLLSEECIL